MFFLKLLSLTHSGGKMFLRYTGMESPRLSDGPPVLLTVNKFPSQFVTHEYIQISNIDIIIYTSMRPHTHTHNLSKMRRSLVNLVTAVILHMISFLSIHTLNSQI